jgi:hypothetical protein
MIEKPAGGVTGFILRSPITNKFFFRVYDPEDKSKFHDYRIATEEIEVTISPDAMLSLYQSEDPRYDNKLWNKLDHNSQVLGTK